MSATEIAADRGPALLHVIASLPDRPEFGIRRGSVGSIVDLLSESGLLVEFCDEAGHAYAIAPCRRSELLVRRDARPAVS